MTEHEDLRCRWCPNTLPAGAALLCRDCQDKEAMLKEGLTTAPELFARKDLERFLWKLAVYAIKAMNPDITPRLTLQGLKEGMEEAIVKSLPLYYVSESTPKRGKAVAYTLKAMIPKAVLFKLVEKLGIWKPIDKEEPDNFTGA